MKIINKLKYWLLRQAIAYIVNQNKNSPYVKNAYREFELTWKDYKKDKMQKLMAEQVIELLSVLATHGDSGTSIHYKKEVFSKLMLFDPIGRLTFEDNEFGIDSFGDGVLQNIRNSAVFKYPNGDITFLNGIVKKDAYYIGEKLEVVERAGGCWSGSMFIFKEDGTFDYIRSSTIIKNKKTFSAKSFTVPTYQIEYPKGWWITIVKEEDLAEVKKEYDLFYQDSNNIEQELNHKNGIYREEILKRIELVKNHINT